MHASRKVPKEKDDGDHKETNRAEEANKKTITVTFGVYVRNNGDGGASAILCATPEVAQQMHDRDDATCGECYTDDVQSCTLEVDPATGEIVSGVETEAPEED